MTSTGTQGKSVPVRSIKVQTSNFVGLNSRLKGLYQKLDTSNLRQVTFPNNQYLSRVVIAGIPTGTPLNMGISYQLTGFSKNNFRIHVTPKFLTNKISSGQSFRLINYGFSQPTILEDTWAIVPNCESSRNFNFPSHCWKCKSYLPSKEDEIFWFVKK